MASTTSNGSGTDSGYISQNGTPVSQPEPSDLLHTLIKPFRKERYLRRFDDVEVPDQPINRFNDLQLQFGRPLKNFLWKRGYGSEHISSNIVVMGKTRDEAKPCVIIQCPDTVAAKIRQFYKAKDVKSHYQPLNPTLTAPILEVFVHPNPLNQNAMWLVGPGSKPLLSMVRSVSLQLGAVKVSHGTSSAIYGFTAGHAFQTHFGGRREADENRIQREGHEVDVEITIDSDDENNDDDLVILDFESTGYNDAREIRTSQKDIGIEGKNTSEESEESAEPRIAIHYMNKPVASSPWAYTDCELYASSVPDGLGLDSDRDWALLKMPPGVAVGLNLPTIIATLSISQSHAKFLPDLCGGRPGRPVKILVTPKYASDQDGLRGFSVPALATCNPEHCGEGFLRAGLSLVMLSSGNDFVQTYNLRFSNGELLPGQCGAWVVDAETDALYGHIIASDSLGETYVVPIQSTFRDIERSLNATSVSLPSVPGLQYEAHYRMISNIGPSDYAGLSDRKSISTHGTSTLEATNLPYLSTSEETTLPVTLEHSELSNIKVSSGSASASDLKDNNTGASPSGDEQLTIDSLAPKESLLTRALAFGSRCLAASLPMPVSRASTVPRESSQFEAHIPSYSPYHATDIVQPGYPLVHTMEHGRPDPWADLLDEQTKARHGGDISYQLTRAMKQLNTHLASPSRSPSIGQNESWYSESIGHQNLLLRAREQLKADSTALGRSPNTSDTSQYVPSFFGSPLPQNSPHAGYNSTSRSSSSKPSLRGVDDSMTLSPTAKPRIRPVIHRGDGNSYSSQSSRMDLARDKRFP